MKTSAKLITVSAVTVALTVVLGWMPFVFLVPLLFTCVTRDWKMTLLESLCFGVISLLFSFASPQGTFVSAAFIANPWIPVVPRLFAGMGCHGVYVLIKKAFKPGSKAYFAVPALVASAVGSVLNTALVVPCLMWRGGTLFGTYELTRALLLAQTLTSGVIELAVAVTVVPPLAVTVGKALRLNGYVGITKHIDVPPLAEIPVSVAADSKSATESDAQSGTANNISEPHGDGGNSD